MPVPASRGMSLGPADLAASRRMKTTRIGGGHPGYLVRNDPDPANPEATRGTHAQDLWHYTIGRMVDACVSVGALPFYGPFGAIDDPLGCEDQFRNAFLMGCVGAWSLHPSQIEIAKNVFSPPADEVSWAKRVLEALPDGSGAVMVDGKMQDDASWKQCKVMVDLARLIADKDPGAKSAVRVLRLDTARVARAAQPAHNGYRAGNTRRYPVLRLDHHGVPRQHQVLQPGDIAQLIPARHLDRCAPQRARRFHRGGDEAVIHTHAPHF